MFALFSVSFPAAELEYSALVVCPNGVGQSYSATLWDSTAATCEVDGTEQTITGDNAAQCKAFGGVYFTVNCIKDESAAAGLQAASGMLLAALALIAATLNQW
jgi:hypothetical protein